MVRPQAIFTAESAFPKLSVEPERRVELRTYALRTGSGEYNQCQTGLIWRVIRALASNGCRRKAGGANEIRSRIRSRRHHGLSVTPRWDDVAAAVSETTEEADR